MVACLIQSDRRADNTDRQCHVMQRLLLNRAMDGRYVLFTRLRFLFLQFSIDSVTLLSACLSVCLRSVSSGLCGDAVGRSEGRGESVIDRKTVMHIGLPNVWIL